MAGQGWTKNKKGFMVNPEGKTARQVRAEKRAASKASGGGGGGGGGGGDDLDALVAGLDTARASYHSKEARQERLKKAKEDRQKAKEDRLATSKEESDRLDALFSKKGKSKQSGDNPDNPRKVNSWGMSPYSDVGTIKQTYLDEISIKNPKKFNEEKLNEAADIIKKAGWNYDPVIVRQKNDDPTSDQHEVIGNAFIYEAAKRAGLERINTILGDGKAENNLKTSRDQEPDTIIAGPKPTFDYKKDRKHEGFLESTDIGTIRSMYLDEISANPQKLDQKKVADAARRFKEGERNWEPVIVRETGRDQYKIVGNAHLYEAAKQAGLERVWTVIGDENTKEYKLGGSQKRRKSKA